LDRGSLLLTLSNRPLYINFLGTWSPLLRSPLRFVIPSLPWSVVLVIDSLFPPLFFSQRPLATCAGSQEIFFFRHLVPRISHNPRGSSGTPFLFLCFFRLRPLFSSYDFPPLGLLRCPQRLGENKLFKLSAALEVLPLRTQSTNARSTILFEIKDHLSRVKKFHFPPFPLVVFLRDSSLFHLVSESLFLATRHRYLLDEKFRFAVRMHADTFRSDGLLSDFCLSFRSLGCFVLKNYSPPLCPVSCQELRICGRPQAPVFFLILRLRLMSALPGPPCDPSLG